MASSAVISGVLAPYGASPATSRGRERTEPPCAFRNCYQRDRDRVIHASAFRRLEHKTQVLLNEHGDHYRTRLTHSLEVAQIARTVARALALNEDLVEVVALAHDLGHAPFGHSGGEALDLIMAPHGGFEHNRQSLRVVELLEHRYQSFRGLNLTFESRESIIKHGRGEGRSVPELSRFNIELGPLLEAQVVDLCDALAYNAHDVDDAVRFGRVTAGDLEDVELWRHARDRAGVEAQAAHMGSRELGSVLRTMVGLSVADLVETTRSRLSGRQIRSLDDVRAQSDYTVAFSEPMAAQHKELKRFLFEHFYRHWRVVRMGHKAAEMIERLFDAFSGDLTMLPPDWRQWCDEVGLERAVCDYIAGMTDRYAQREVSRLCLPFVLT